MKYLLQILSILFLFIACNPKTEDTAHIVAAKKRMVLPHNYTTSTLPHFFEEMIAYHLNDFAWIDSSDYQDVCYHNSLQANDSSNLKTFYTLKIIHALLTSQDATNGSKGKILNIPYFWHWQNPNPRHEIIWLETHQKLSLVKAPKLFEKYASYADIDRTPYLYLSELCSDKAQYYSPLCDTFATFGWCSEREMAYVCLMDLLGYKGKVIAEGNHSWSEFLIPMKTERAETRILWLKVDNTFDVFRWETRTEDDLKQWEKRNASLPLAKWYNQKAHDKGEIQKLKDFVVPPQAVKRIETAFVNYLNL